jgi:lysophospholipase L1-like esterase
MAMSAWTLIIDRAVARNQGVDLSSVSGNEPDLGYVLQKNECFEFPYAQQDPESYLPGVPTWELCANSMGFRGPDFSVERKPNSYRVVCMGDSSTMGQGVPYQRTFCRRFGDRLELLMAPQGISVEVIDAGIWGYASYQGLILYEKYVRQWHTDLVVVAYGTNDRRTLKKTGIKSRDRYRFKPYAEKGRATPYIDASGFYLQRVVRLALRTIEERWLDSHRKQDIWEGDVPFASRQATPVEYEENMRALLHNIAADGSAAVVLGIAIQEDEYKLALQRAAAECNVPFIPTWEALAEAEPLVRSGQIFRSERDEIDRWLRPEAHERPLQYSRWLTIDGAHPTIIGHQIIADELYRVFEKELAGRLRPPS